MADYDSFLMSLPTPGSSNPVFDMHSDGWYSQSDSLVVRVNHYLKRGWNTTTNAYVEWESTDRDTPYPGGGTVEPIKGTVIYQWVTVNGFVV